MQPFLPDPDFLFHYRENEIARSRLSVFYLYTGTLCVFFFYNTVPVLRVHNGATLPAIMKRNDEAFIELFVIINIMWNIYMKNVYSNRL